MVFKNITLEYIGEKLLNCNKRLQSLPFSMENSDPFCLHFKLDTKKRDESSAAALKPLALPNTCSDAVATSVQLRNCTGCTAAATQIIAAVQ